MWGLRSGMLLGREEEGRPAICDNVGGPSGPVQSEIAPPERDKPPRPPLCVESGKAKLSEPEGGRWLPGAGG